MKNSKTEIDAASLTLLDEALDSDELIECRSILMDCTPKVVSDACFDIAVTLNVGVVERKGNSAVFFRKKVQGGIKLFDSNNADGKQFVKHPRTPRDSRGRPIKE